MSRSTKAPYVSFKQSHSISHIAEGDHLISPINVGTTLYICMLLVSHSNSRWNATEAFNVKPEASEQYGDGAIEKWWQSDNIVWKYRWLSAIRGPCCGWLGLSPRWWQKNVTWEQRNCRLQLPSDIHGEKCFGTRTNTSRSDFGKEEKQKSVTVKTVKAKDTATLTLMIKVLFWIY